MNVRRRIGLTCFVTEESDGIYTVTLDISGVTAERVQAVSEWLRGLVVSNAHQIGEFHDDTAPTAH